MSRFFCLADFGEFSFGVVQVNEFFLQFLIVSSRSNGQQQKLHSGWMTSKKFNLFGSLSFLWLFLIAMLSKFFHSAVHSRCFLIIPLMMVSENQLQWIEQTFCLQVVVSAIVIYCWTLGAWFHLTRFSSHVVFASLHRGHRVNLSCTTFDWDNNLPALNKLQFTTVLLKICEACSCFQVPLCGRWLEQGTAKFAPNNEVTCLFRAVWFWAALCYSVT